MARLDAVDKKTIQKIEKLAESVLRAVKGGKNPFVEIPIRSLANVKFNEKRRLIELGSQRQKRYFFNVSHGEEVHADVPRLGGLQGAHRLGQDDEHPRPLLHDEAHPRGHEAEHLRGAGGVRPHHRGPRGRRRLAPRGAAPLRHRPRLDGRPDHHPRLRRHHRPAPHGLGRLVGAVHRRGARHPVREDTRRSTSSSSRRTRSGSASTRTSSGSARSASSSPGRASRRAACAGSCSASTAS